MAQRDAAFDGVEVFLLFDDFRRFIRGVFVADVADDVGEDVLQGDEALNVAVFVHHEAATRFGAAELQQLFA